MQHYGVENSNSIAQTSLPVTPPVRIPPVQGETLTEQRNQVALATRYGCTGCHSSNIRIVGPAPFPAIPSGEVESLIRWIRDGDRVRSYSQANSIDPADLTAENRGVAANELKIETLASGSGPSPKNGDTVTVHYTGFLTNGKKFDSSLDRNQSFPFVLGAGQVIQGWDLGLAKMKVGDKVKLTIPPELAYGQDGYPGVIPPNSTLIFEVELLAIKPA